MYASCLLMCSISLGYRQIKREPGHARLNTVDKTSSPKFFEASTRLAKVKTESPKLYLGATRFAEVETDSPKFHKSATRFAKVKTDSPMFYKSATCFAKVKTESPNFYKGTQNGVYEALHHRYKLSGSQNIK